MLQACFRKRMSGLIVELECLCEHGRRAVDADVHVVDIVVLLHVAG